MTSQALVQHQADNGTGMAELSDHEWAALERRALVLSKVSYLPEAFRGKPNDIMAAGLSLVAMGKPLTPLTLQLCYVIKGRVDYMYTLYAALVHEHGHEMWVVSESETSATVAGRRRGSDIVHEVTFTLEDAQRAKLVERNETYKAYPRDMFIARAGKRCAKRVCPEALLGLPAPVTLAETSAGRLEVVSLPDDDEPVDAEIVGDGVIPGGEPVDSGCEDGSIPATVAAVTHEPPDDLWCPASAVEWREFCATHRVKTAALLKRGREAAGRAGIAPPPDIDGLVECDEIAQELAAWVVAGGPE